MRKVILVILLMVIGIGGIWFYMQQQERQNSSMQSSQAKYTATSATEKFIINDLLDENGMIRTNFPGKEGGELMLSESMGLWLEYFVAKQDEQSFAIAFDTIERHFLLENELIGWKVESGRLADVNALIDDLRIVEGLFKMGELSGNEQYLQMAKNISRAILRHNQNNGMFVDFYDSTHQYANDTLTVSYMNLDAFRYMEKYALISTDLLMELEAFMRHLPQEDLFYPQTYDVRQQSYAYDDIINLIDQLYIVLHLERASIATEAFYKWLKMEFYQNGFLYGRYDSATKEPAVDYEAASVYALAVMYSLLREDAPFALDLYEQMKQLQIQDPASKYDGGYVVVDQTRTHSFDNLLPLLAERMLANADLLE